MRIVTALTAEARPITRHFGLELVSNEPFRLYRGDGIELIVSGVGSAASATAVGYLAGGSPRRPRGWLNVGIAGHRDAPIGSARLAAKVVQVPTGRSWYPPAVFDPPCPGATVRTVDEVELEPTDDALYEMEAAGFYEEALHFATAELIQVLKVVSDNRDHRPELLTAAAVEELIEVNLPILETLVGKITSIAGSLEARSVPPAALDGFRARWRFTVTQGRQLERLLRRLAALGRPVAPEALAGSDSAAAVLADLRARI